MVLGRLADLMGPCGCAPVMTRPCLWRRQSGGPVPSPLSFQSTWLPVVHAALTSGPCTLMGTLRRLPSPMNSSMGPGRKANSDFLGPGIC